MFFSKYLINVKSKIFISIKSYFGGVRVLQIISNKKKEKNMTNLEIPEKVKIWKFGGKSGNIVSQNNYSDNTGYNLFCQSNNKYLTWKKVPLGINLDFISDAAVKKIHFRLPDGKQRAILSGESVAFGIGGGEAFLKYAHRTLGINLEWKQDPVYQWRVFGAGSQLGTPISTDSLVAIVNDKVEPAADFLIYFDRPRGMADVGWTTSPEFFNKIVNAAEKIGIEAAKKGVAALIAA